MSSRNVILLLSAHLRIFRSNSKCTSVLSYPYACHKKDLWRKQTSDSVSKINSNYQFPWTTQLTGKTVKDKYKRAENHGRVSRICLESSKLKPLMIVKRLSIAPFDGGTSLRHFSTNSVLHKGSAHLSGAKKLSKKAVVRPKTKKPTVSIPRQELDLWMCYAYSTGEEYHLEHLSLDLQSQDIFAVASLPTDAHDALHMTVDTNLNNQEENAELSELFIFRNGSVVFWNVPENLIKKVLQTAYKHQTQPYEIALVNWENENMAYGYDENDSRLSSHQIYLDSRKTQEDLSMDKFAFSNAMVLSVKLAMWEFALDEFVASIEHIPESLVAHGKLKMSHSEVMKKVGRLYSISHRINLSSDLLISPDFYWDRDHLEKLYQRMCSFLMINYRTNVMNQKLSHCSDLIDIMRSDVNDVHSSRLEIMIILLIAIEIVFELIHFVRTWRIDKEREDHDWRSHPDYDEK